VIAVGVLNLAYLFFSQNNADFALFVILDNLPVQDCFLTVDVGNIKPFVTHHLYLSSDRLGLSKQRDDAGRNLISDDANANEESGSAQPWKGRARIIGHHRRSDAQEPKSG
jgi:hypothetical protein